MAATPFGQSANDRPAEGASMPGKRKFCAVMWPRTASMAMRPCLISTYRRRSKRSYASGMEEGGRERTESHNRLGECVPYRFERKNVSGGAFETRGVFVPYPSQTRQKAATFRDKDD